MDFLIILPHASVETEFQRLCRYILQFYLRVYRKKLRTYKGRALNYIQITDMPCGIYFSADAMGFAAAFAASILAFMASLRLALASNLAS